MAAVRSESAGGGAALGSPGWAFGVLAAGGGGSKVSVRV